MVVDDLDAPDPEEASGLVIDEGVVQAALHRGSVEVTPVDVEEVIVTGRAVAARSDQVLAETVDREALSTKTRLQRDDRYNRAAFRMIEGLRDFRWGQPLPVEPQPLPIMKEPTTRGLPEIGRKRTESRSKAGPKQRGSGGRVQIVRPRKDETEK